MVRFYETDCITNIRINSDTKLLFKRKNIKIQDLQIFLFVHFPWSGVRENTGPRKIKFTVGFTIQATQVEEIIFSYEMY